MISANRHTKQGPRQGKERKPPVKGIFKNFLEHLENRKEGKPTTKAGLRLVYYQEFRGKFLSSFPHAKAPSFSKLLTGLKWRKTLKVERDGTDEKIRYLGRARFATDQHFGRLKREETTIARELPNDEVAGTEDTLLDLLSKQLKNKTSRLGYDISFF